MLATHSLELCALASDPLITGGAVARKQSVKDGLGFRMATWKLQHLTAPKTSQIITMKLHKFDYVRETNNLPSFYET